MKKPLKLALAAAGLAVVGVAATGAAVYGKAQRGVSPEKIDRIFEMLDADGDGAISREEAANARAMRLRSGDLNGDGGLSLEEMKAAAVAKAEKRAERMFSRLDANGDGVVGETEIANARSRHHGEKRIGRMFKRFDADGDGRITRDEIEAKRRQRREN